ncbi:protease modulator HflC [Legionella jordanis]|uniref:Protein HflC n=1 Tax=Legionella jordanis TaxID=456 RepID=A0A0W0VBX1_9GAMM|nr:protease modulator HflC [Legionella jordanis]KTD17350.1 HflC protein [Legionella jordanis]RMX01882.1 protease modulator HflC [Legionella jordanis]RMX17672.1 protease modulator HflC [Legionella jordanis]VEH11633.1 HflC protein [Legionella jordanis]HAT8712989.1 protease modulator HflC [Legionella jordanis]
MNATKTTLAILGFVILIILFASVFTITQGQHGILLRLGRLVLESDTKKVKILGPGLHVKTPFIENVRIFDTRIQTLDIKSSRIVTKEKKDIIVGYYVKWKIDDLAQYYKSTGGNEFKAETLLEQQLNTYLRAEIGKRVISEVSGSRDDVTEKLRDKAQEQAAQLGIRIIDVRIKGLEFPENTSNNIFQFMRANMQRIANSHRADGNAAAEAVRAAADAEVTVLLAQAQSQGQQIRAGGQAEAAKIYADAFNQNPDFFAFYRSLKAYEASFNNKQSILVLDQSSAFFDYFRSGLVKLNGTGLKKPL